MKQILIIDDDTYINDMLSELLAGESYKVLNAFSGTEALLLLNINTPDLVLLDLMLPGLCGEEVLTKIKNIPVIVMSAKNDVSGKVELLLNGAVDYITKPFDTQELLARIKIHLRNINTITADNLTFKNLTLSLQSQSATINDKSVKLTRTEFAILKLLIQNPTQIVTKSTILTRISEDTPDCTENSLKIHISNLRKKLRDISGCDYIEAVWGIGYKMAD